MVLIKEFYQLENKNLLTTNVEKKQSVQLCNMQILVFL
jgi:hypothetical protein